MNTPAISPAPLMSRGWHRRKVDRLVVHAMGEHIENTDAKVGPVGYRVPAYVWLGAIGLSAHALIKPDGEILECIPLNQRAYHAQGHNDGTVGVEMLVTGSHNYASLAFVLGWDLKAWRALDLRGADPYTVAQYASLAWWLERSASDLGLGWEAVTSHDRLDPDRKFDPGPLFDWQRAAVAFQGLRHEREAGPLGNPEE